MTLIDKHIEMFDDDDYFTDEQLQTAKDLLANQNLYGQEKTSSYIHTVTFWWATADLEYYTNYNYNLEKVTRDDIKEYVRKYIQGQPHATGLLLTEEMRSSLGVNDYFQTTVD